MGSQFIVCPSSQCGCGKVMTRHPRFSSDETRIAIIGAGASGLSLAYLLQEAGFRNVTVFEKEERVGGKCKTLSIDGRSYELGAVVHFPRSLAGARLLRRFSSRTGTEPPPILLHHRPLPYRSVPQIVRAGIRYGMRSDVRQARG